MSSTTTGLIAREDGPPVDFATLRRERTQRVLAAMEEHDVDVLILARPANVRYAVGARQLWMAGTRPFGPGCTITRSGAIHLIGTGDEGVPPEVDREHLIGMSWNPMTLVEAVGAIDGIADARRIGVDGMTLLFSQLLPGAAPDAELVDADALLRPVRGAKLPAEVACIRTALAVAEGALAATLEQLRPGVTERGLRARYLEAIAQAGVTTPALDPVFTVADDAGPVRHLVSDRPVETGDLVRCHVGVLYAGYEGSLIRTVACPDTRGRVPTDGGARAAWQRAYDALEAACVPGASADDLRGAYTDAGGQPPAGPLVHGVGCGFEAPVIGAEAGPRDATIEDGMVLHLTAAVADGTTTGSEVVHVTTDGPRRLTRLGHRALGAT